MTTAPARLYGPNGQPVNGHAVDTPKRAEAIPSIRFAPLPITLPQPAAEPSPPVEEHARAAPVRLAADPIAEAEAEAIRTRSAAEAEVRRIKAEAEAKAIETKAAEETRKLKLANDKAEARAREEQAARDARIAASERKQAEEVRRAAADRRAAEETKKADEVAAKQLENAEDSWRYFAIAFAVACGVVALPVQMAAFWHPHSPWMIAAPFMLEAGAWVVLRGAAAAVAGHRPHWHFRLIAWLLAFVAAGINLWHGLHAFDPATAVGTAFASLAGPGVWDLHEHGRIRKRDGKPTRAQRKQQQREEKRATAAKKAEEARRAAEKAATEKAATEAAEKLSEEREELYPEEWKRALALAAALGEATVTETVWRRAWRDLHAADPGETVDVVRSRNVASIRMSKAVTEGAEKSAEKGVSSQRATQIPPPSGKTRPKPIPPRRQRGDSIPFHAAAKVAAAATARRSMADAQPKEI